MEWNDWTISAPLIWWCWNIILVLQFWGSWNLKYRVDFSLWTERRKTTTADLCLIFNCVQLYQCINHYFLIHTETHSIYLYPKWNTVIAKTDLYLPDGSYILIDWNPFYSALYIQIELPQVSSSSVLIFSDVLFYNIIYLKIKELKERGSWGIEKVNVFSKKLDRGLN